MKCFWQSSEARISSWEDLTKFFCSCLIEQITKQRSDGHPLLLFRGMKCGQPLMASIASFRGNIQPFKLDKAMFNEFKKRAASLPDLKMCSNDWDIISLGRHFGLPTRYLDWSSNPLVSLWFAIHTWENGKCSLSKESIKNTPVIWVLETHEEDFVKIVKNASPFPQNRDGKTKIFKTRNKIPRVDNQASFMMRQVFISKNDSVKTPEMVYLERINENTTFNNRVWPVAIASGFVPELNYLIESLGINYSFLFPEENDEEAKELHRIVDEIRKGFKL